jgi:hypothetical protein
VIDERGRQILPLRFEEVGAIHDRLFAIRQAGKWGIVDGRGREVFAATFERAMPFNRKIAIFCREALCGLIDKAGTVLLEPTYAAIRPLSDRLAVAMMMDDGGRLVSSGLIDAGGQVLVGQEYYTFAWFSEYLLLAQAVHGGYRLLQQSTGQPVPDLPETSGTIGPLSDGLAAVNLRDAAGKGSAGYIDSRGRVVIPPRFGAGQAGNFLKGVAIVHQEDRCGAIDRRGKEILPIRYRHCQQLSDGRVLFAEEAPLRLPLPGEPDTRPPGPGSSAP